MITPLRLMTGMILLLAASVQPIIAQTPTPPLKGQDLVWATIAFRAVAGSYSIQTRGTSHRVHQMMLMDDLRAKDGEKKAILNDLPDVDRMKAWGDALAKQVGLNHPRTPMRRLALQRYCMRRMNCCRG